MAERKPEIGSIGVFISATLSDTPVYIIMVCQTDLTFSRSRDVVDANSKCGPDQLPANTMTTEITGTSQILLGDTDQPIFGGKASEALMDELVRNRTTINWKIGPLSGIEVPGDVVKEGTGFVSSLDTSYPNDDVATFDFTITAKGDYTQTIEPATT
ncbi:Phage tail tube protein [Chitinophaga eiseniae]|uniref:Phage tail tube protein n=1 Tax=Chitinophaga eiseniae TaxID=634771 RepID=A0A1T4SNJ4_9BACT|nr:phage tail tube protein [Chitinophaga eiseniae]SKA29765.1 Phage tail tube protein [Chitinophaga eiseniae]